MYIIVLMNRSIKSTINKMNLTLLAVLFAVFGAGGLALPAYAAPTTENVGATTVTAPNTSELAAVQIFANEIMSFSGSNTQLVTSTRTPGVNSFNTGLNAPDVVNPTDIMVNEAGFIPFASAYQCEPDRAVTINVSSWSLTLTMTDGDSPGGGGGLVNMANPSITDPASTAVYTGGGFTALPQTNTEPGGSFTTTFGELDNYRFVIGASVKGGDDSTPGDPSDDTDSSYTFVPPTIELEYDNEGCTLIQSNSGSGNSGSGSSISNPGSSSSASPTDASAPVSGSNEGREALANTGSNFAIPLVIASFAVTLSTATSLSIRKKKV